MTEKIHKKDIISIVYMSVLTLGALVYGFMTIPSPIVQRNVRFDHQRIADLGQIKNSIDEYYRTNHKLPASLQDLKTPSYDSYQSYLMTDPETNTPYDYKVINETPPSIQLCADFATDSKKDDAKQVDYSNYEWQTYASQYQHPKGRYCFTEDVRSYASNDLVSPTPESLTPTTIPKIIPKHPVR